MSEFRADLEPLVAPGAIDHHVGDMTATVAADVPLRRVQASVAAAQQWLPIDGDPDLSVGELVETNSTGPLRLGYGAWRDLLLGAQFRNGSGELITAGGRTVKNVAGYDLTKFMVGQRGVFGKIVTITMRLYKRPAGAILATFEPNARLIGKLLPSTTRPQWAMLTADALLCGYVADALTLDFYETTLAAADVKPRTIERRTLEQDIEHRAQLFRGDFRVSVPPAKVADFIAVAKPTKWVADPAFGIVVGAGDDLQIRGAAQALSGTASFPRRDGSAGPLFDVPSPAQRQLLERLKKSFDPDNRLAPLPWQAQTAQTSS
ncbi:MAG: glycolate oxidase binding subunit [Phycisphaerales bacterium]|jgi:glycolate oxidase FAD binding subunit|nr:glycolate oxidase binding subunit [Phycisphaerales bacterium]